MYDNCLHRQERMLLLLYLLMKLMPLQRDVTDRIRDLGIQGMMNENRR